MKKKLGTNNIKEPEVKPMKGGAGPSGGVMW
jgi:hypothetical protein